MCVDVQSPVSVLLTLLCFCHTTVHAYAYTNPAYDGRIHGRAPPSRPVYPPPSPPPSPNRFTYCPKVHCPTLKCPAHPPHSPPPGVNCNCHCNAGSSCPPPTEQKDKCKWHLVFKAIKGNGRNVYTDFTDSTTINPNSAEAMMLSSNTMPFKSQKLNEWNQMVIKQVKVDVFNEGERKAWFLFDGTASTRTNWFSQDRLIASPYSNLKTGTFAFFSAEGKPSANTRFFINENDGPCGEDCGYLAVVDTGADQCPWALIEPQPYFLYNPNIDNCCVWNDATDCSDAEADVMFVIDVSTSIDTAEFGQMIAFVKDVVAGLPVASDRVRIGAISFANDVTFDFQLNDDFTQAGVQALIDGITNTNGATRTDLALNFLKSTAYLPANGNRPGVPDIVILLTDGASTDSTLTQMAIANIATENYMIFTVGIGNNLNVDELNDISSDPDSIFSLLADFDSLDQILQQLLGSACVAASPPRAVGQDDPSTDKVADVFAVSVKTCELDW